MDELGFKIGESQTIKVLVPITHNQKNKIMTGKQEWIIDIECINTDSG